MSNNASGATGSRPTIHGAGMFGDVLNSISARVPPRLIQLALFLFLAFMAWDYYSKAQQINADLNIKRAEAASMDAEASALNADINNRAAQTAAALAELTKLQNEAQLADLDAKTNALKIGDGTARLATLRAELTKTQADADQADAEQKSLNQLVNGGIKLAVAQKRAELVTIEGQAKTKLRSLCITLNGVINEFTDSGQVNVGSIFDNNRRKPDYCPGLQ